MFAGAIISADDAYPLVRNLWDSNLINLQEQFMAVYLNTANKVIGYKVLNTGSMNQCIVDVKLLVSLALHCMANSVIIVHNHPSGNLRPSSNDETITLKIKEALKLIDVKLLDHLIINNTSFNSFAELGML